VANDKIIMECRNCSKNIMLAKYYPNILGHGVWNEDVVCDFINEHMKCSPNFGKMDLGGDRCFNLYTEMEDTNGIEAQAQAKEMREKEEI
jgi:hypothetical protein